MKIKRFILQLAGKEPWTFCEVDIPVEKVGDWSVAFDQLNAESIVYSFGIGDDVELDLALINNIGVTVFAFDPTPLAVDWVTDNVRNDKFKFYPYGIASEDGEIIFSQRESSGSGAVMFSAVKEPVPGRKNISCQVFRLQTLMKQLEHDKIDLLKLDIEGMEYEVITDILASSIRPRHICLEVHHRFFAEGKTKTENMVRDMRAAGYQIYALSGLGREYSFIYQGD